MLSLGIIPQSGNYVRNYYDNSYRVIAAINTYLANVDKMITGNKLTRYKAEAKILGYSGNIQLKMA